MILWLLRENYTVPAFAKDELASSTAKVEIVQMARWGFISDSLISSLSSHRISFPKVLAIMTYFKAVLVKSVV